MRIYKIHRIFVVLMLLMAVSEVRAQWDFDMASVEAMISDHKRMRSVLLARATLEQANEVLHQANETSLAKFDSVSINFDKYTKCFDIIDAVYHGGMTVMNIKNTYDDVSKRIGLIKDLIENYTKRCALRGDLETSDTQIIDVCKRTFNNASDEAKSLYTSFGTLIAYATGAKQCTTEDIIVIMQEINDALDNIRENVDYAYFKLSRYITIRLTYWKAPVHRSKSVREVANSAFERWREAGLKVVVK